MKFKNLIKLFLGLLLFALSISMAFGQTTVTITPSTTYQVHEGFGTSLCWFGNVIGGYPDAKRNDIADLLFDKDLGLGINVVRYNIGGGENPSHDHMRPGAEVEGYQPSQGNWNWNADATQRWMLQAAKSRVPSGEFVAEAFSNSPPYWMTNSNCTAGGSGGSNNLGSSYYDDFADYVTEVVLHFRDYWGITFDTLNPMNEPGISWTVNGGQEGCSYSTSNQAAIINEVYAAMSSKGITGTIVSVPDGCSVGNTISFWNSYNSTTRSHIGQINTHGYSGSTSEMNSLRSSAASAGKRLWMSECDSGGKDGEPFGDYPYNPDDIVPGIVCSKQVYTYLKNLQPLSWVLWQAVENWPNMIRENLNWGLILANFEGDGSQGIAYQDYRTTKKYYSFAQYSKHIRPGMQNIGINMSNAVAFIDWNANRLVIVQTNDSTSSQNYTYDLSQFSSVGSSATVYRTSSSQDHAQLSNISISNQSFGDSLPGRSITTFIIDNVTMGATPTPSPTPPPGDYTPISQSVYSLEYVDSEETSGEDGAATNFFDGSTSTIWHTQWDGASPSHPHEIQIDLGTTYDVGGVRYLPRQDSTLNGTIAGYQLYVSTSTSTWGTAVSTGTWANSSSEKEVLFTPKAGRYVRLIATSEVNGNVWTSGAEFNILEYTGSAPTTAPPTTPPPTTPPPTTAPPTTAPPTTPPPTTPPPGGVLDFEDFESGFGSWTNITGDESDWQRNTGTTPSSSTGPDGDNTTGSGYYIYMETSSGYAYTSGDEVILESQEYDATGNNISISFYYHMYGSNIGSLNVDVYDGSWDYGVWSISGQQHSSSSADYTQANVNLSSYSGTIRIRIRGVAAGSYRGDIAVDDIEIRGDGAPPTPTPTPGPTTPPPTTPPPTTPPPTTPPPTTPPPGGVVYYVDSGDDSPTSLESGESFGSRNSREDQVYGSDPSTGYSWGYQTYGGTWSQDTGTANWDSLRTDEGDTAGQGITYRFAVSNGTYDVDLGFYDPWSNGSRGMDIVIEGTTRISDFVPGSSQQTLNYTASVSDGELTVGIIRNSGTTGQYEDPMVSWIEVSQ